MRPSCSLVVVLMLALSVLCARATPPWTMEQTARFEHEHTSARRHFEPAARPGHRGISLDDPEYYQHFLMLCDFLGSLQCTTPGDDFGGMTEGESYPENVIVETDNTQEAIREWSQYAIWSDDTATYGQRIRRAQEYCGRFPAWEEGFGGTAYYSAHNCGWGFEAVRKYREAYGDTSWDWYADACANWLYAYYPTWDYLVEGYAEALGIGGMYAHAVYRGRQDWIQHCVNRGRVLKSWLEEIPARLSSETWALSGGTAVWGLTETLFREYPDSGAIWVQEWGDQVQIWESEDVWTHPWNAWYANAQHRMYELTGDSTYWNNAMFIGDSLIGLDLDVDGGITPGYSYTDDEDVSWVSCYMGWMGMERVINRTPSQDAAVVAFVSPDPSHPYLAGDPLTIGVRVANTGRLPIGGQVRIRGQNEYSDSANVSLGYGQDTVVFLQNLWTVPDTDSLPDQSLLWAVFASPLDTSHANDSLATEFDIRHGVSIHGLITDDGDPNIHVAATVEVYHESYPDSVWACFEAPAGGEYTSGPRMLLEGRNRVVLTPALRYLTGDSIVDIGWEDSPGEVNFSLGLADLLLVDDDAGRDYEQWYLAALDSLPSSLRARLWHRSAAPVDSLGVISRIVWFCGDDSVSTLDESDQTLLQGFLSIGGDVLLSGQNITEDEVAAPFLTTVMQCSLRTRNTDTRWASGVNGDPIGDGTFLIMEGEDGANNQNGPSSVWTFGSATEFLHYYGDSDETCGLRGLYGAGRYAFVSFGIEAISASQTATSRWEFLRRCFAWFDSSESARAVPSVPVSVTLAQNYPNPFNPNTVIRFVAPPSVGPVSLIVYNILGQEVRALYRGPGQNGTVTLIWDGLTNGGEMATSGMYVYRLRTARGEFARPLQLLR